MKFRWRWCTLCHAYYIECPKCGNNCCNGTYGEYDGQQCDICELAYQYQDKGYKYFLPKRKVVYRIKIYEGKWYKYIHAADIPENEREEFLEWFKGNETEALDLERELVADAIPADDYENWKNEKRWPGRSFW